MIVIKVNGGLGNQMFQYAFGRAISLQLNTQLKLDVSWFNEIPKTDTIREYELNCFNIKPLIASDDEIKKTKGPIGLFPKRVSSFLRKMNILFESSYVMEKEFYYNPAMLLSVDNSYFEGYWQSYRYFDKYKEVIKKDFLENYSLSKDKQNILEKVKSCNTISLHIRRGDYVSNANANNYHGVSSLKYYYEAIKYIKDKIENPYFIIFSDDIDWVKKNLKVESPLLFIENQNNDRPFDDIYLMSLCKHNIIANSSFSWWGAYLNMNSNKIVIAPKKWFNDSSKNTNDLIPTDWKRF